MYLDHSSPCHKFVLPLPPHRTTLDLGIVKKSMVVDDVSEKKGGSYFSLSEVLKDTFSHVGLWSVLPPQWFPLKDTPSGRVHFRLEWLTLLPSTDQLEQVRVTLICFFSSTRRAACTIYPLALTLTIHKSLLDPQKEREPQQPIRRPAFVCHSGGVFGQG